MMTTGTTPAAGVDHPVAHALVDALALLRPVADPGEIRLWQLGDDQCLTTMLTVQHVESVVAAIKLQLLGVMEERQVTQHTTNLGTATWLNGTTASSLNAAYRETGPARGLHRRFPSDHDRDGRRRGIRRASRRDRRSVEKAAGVIVG
jgi:hypothetical protein